MIRGGQGLSLSIAIDIAKEIAYQLIRTGKVFKAYLGLMLQEVEIPIKFLRHFALPGTRGLFITKIEEESPASRGCLLQWICGWQAAAAIDY